MAQTKAAPIATEPAATKPAAEALPFVQLDYLYTPSTDVVADARYFSQVLGGKVVFAIEGMGARVAKIELTGGPPHVLLTDHLEGERPIFVYRVVDLEESMRDMEKRGWRKASTLEIPMGPCCSFTTPTGHRVAIYELTRPDVAKHFDGRFDF